MYCIVEHKQNNLIDPIITSLNNISVFDFSKYTKIKLLCNFCSSLELSLLWNKMTKGNLKWNKLQVSINDKDIIDYYIIINQPNNEFYDPKKTIVFRMEPDTDLIDQKTHWDNWFEVKNHKKEDFLFYCDLNRYRNNTEWHLGNNYDQLSNLKINKTNILSSVVSSLYNNEGQKYRIDLLKCVELQNYPIDIYGRENLHNFKNYKGSLPSHNKDNGILPYKYTVISENTYRKNYFTEKLSDAILSETLCFYRGCPNIKDFLDEQSYILLPQDLKEAFELIKTSIKNNEYEKRLPFIKKEKEKLLNYYNFFPRIEGLIEISKLNKIVIKNSFNKELEDNLKKHDIRNYQVIKFDNIKSENDVLIINKNIESNHFNDRLAIVYKKVKLKENWDILILNESDQEYCEIELFKDKFDQNNNYILNHKSINKQPSIIYCISNKY